MVTSIRKFFLERKNALPEELQLLFLKQLHRLLANGYPLIEALEVLSWDRQLKQTAFTMITSLKRGLAIDQAFEKGLFHRTIVAHLYRSEEHTPELQSRGHLVCRLRLENKKGDDSGRVR